MGHGASLPQDKKLCRLVAIKMFVASITVRELRRKFQRFDTDSRGLITQRLAEHLLATAINKPHLHVSTHHIRAFVQRFAPTKSRSLFDYNDCCAWLMHAVRADCGTKACMGSTNDSSTASYYDHASAASPLLVHTSSCSTSTHICASEMDVRLTSGSARYCSAVKLGGRATSLTASRVKGSQNCVQNRKNRPMLSNYNVTLRTRPATAPSTSGATELNADRAPPDSLRSINVDRGPIVAVATKEPNGQIHAQCTDARCKSGSRHSLTREQAATLTRRRRKRLDKRRSQMMAQLEDDFKRMHPFAPTFHSKTGSYHMQRVTAGKLTVPLPARRRLRVIASAAAAASALFKSGDKVRITVVSLAPKGAARPRLLLHPFDGLLLGSRLPHQCQQGNEWQMPSSTTVGKLSQLLTEAIGSPVDLWHSVRQGPALDAAVRLDSPKLRSTYSYFDARVVGTETHDMISVCTLYTFSPVPS